MALPTKLPRDKALTVRVSKRTYNQLETLAERHRLSQADVIEALIEQEYREDKRIKGKDARVPARFKKMGRFNG
jgi:predicted transcriptional regulator